MHKSAFSDQLPTFHVGLPIHALSRRSMSKPERIETKRHSRQKIGAINQDSYPSMVVGSSGCIDNLPRRLAFRCKLYKNAMVQGMVDRRTMACRVVNFQAGKKVKPKHIEVAL